MRDLHKGIVGFVALCSFFVCSATAEDDANEGPDSDLIINGNMETIGHWHGFPVGNVTVPRIVDVVDADKHEGEQSLLIVIERVDLNDFPMVSSDKFTTDEGSYKISFWCKVISGAFNVLLRTGADDNYVNLSKSPIVGGGGWELFEYEYLEKSSGPYARLCFTSAVDGECEMYVDDVSVKSLSR